MSKTYTAEEKAITLAQEFHMDAKDIQDTYKDKPASLAAHFNAVSEAKEKKGWYVGWTIFWALAAAPVALYPIYKLAEKYKSLSDVKDTVRQEVQNFKDKGPASEPVPAPAPL